MVNVVADRDRNGLGCIVGPDVIVLVEEEALSKDPDSDDDELEDDERAAALGSLSCVSSSMGSGGSGAL